MVAITSRTRSILRSVLAIRRNASSLLILKREIPATSSKIRRRSSGLEFKIASIRFCPIMAMESLPRPVSASKRCMSFKRQERLLMRNSLSPVR